jgi:hypothetical protein
MTVSASDPVVANDPFSSSVTITNTGFIPLRSVYATIHVNKIVARAGGLAGPDDKYGSWLTPVQWGTHDLGLDDRFAVSLEDALTTDKNGIDSADIAIGVTYEIPYIHLTREKIFPLVTYMERDGRFHWYAASMPK